jgi:hypothetical protein
LRGGLLLAPPSIATQEDKLRDLFSTFDRSTTDLQMLDRAFMAGTRVVYTFRVRSCSASERRVPSVSVRMRTASDAMEAVLAGLVQSDNGFEKPNFEPSAAVPLKFGLKKKNKLGTAVGVGLFFFFRPNFKGTAAEGSKFGFSKPLSDCTVTNHDRDEDDELINEDTLLSEEDLTRPIMPRMCVDIRGIMGLVKSSSERSVSSLMSSSSSSRS